MFVRLRNIVAAITQCLIIFVGNSCILAFMQESHHCSLSDLVYFGKISC